MRFKASGLLSFAALCATLALAGPASAADPCPNAAFRTGASAGLPDCRAYEMVSPLDKNGGSIDRNELRLDIATSGAAPSGQAIAYAGAVQFSDLEAGAYDSTYRSIREQWGWVTQGLTPPVDPNPFDNLNSSRVEGLSENLGKAVVRTGAELIPGAEALLNGSWGLYLQQKTLLATDYQLLSAPTIPLSLDEDGVRRFRFAVANPDMSHVVFTTRGRQLTPDGVEGVGDGVYEWTNGELRSVSVLPPAFAAFPIESALAGSADTVFQNNYPGDHAISDDGDRIYFSARYSIPPGLNGEGIFVRENGATTKHVSTSERSGADPLDSNGTFLAAAADGSLSLFASELQLTDDATAGNDLYLWEAEAPEGERLTDLTTDDPAGAGFIGLAAASDDLSSIYFVANGVLAAGASAGDCTTITLSGTCNLYLWRAGQIRLVAQVTGLDASIWSLGRNQPKRRYRDARVSSDGSRLLFASHQQLTPFDNAGNRQVYLFDADAAPASQLTCLSCSQLAPSSTADADLFPLALRGSGTNAPARLPRNLSAGGARAFFETTEPLIADDHNQVADVYMWEDGSLYLISSGRLGASEANFIDASASGDDVFFTSRERLASADSDDQVDVYDARVGGGFPAAVVHDCLAEACRDVRPSPPPAGTPATSGFLGAGNLRRGAERCAPAKLMRGGHCVAKRAIARRACRTRQGAAKRRCIARHLRHLNRPQGKRMAHVNRRAHR